MSKKTIELLGVTNQYRNDYYNNLMSKYFELYMSSYECPQVGYRENLFLFQKLWGFGEIACWKDDKHVVAKDDKVPLVFAQVAAGTTYLDNYGFDKYVQIFNEYNCPWYPKGLLQVGKDIVIGYANKSRKSVKSKVEWYVNRMTDIAMVRRVNVFIQKMPWLINTNPDNQTSVKVLVNRLMSDEPFLFADKGIGNFEVLTSGAPYVIDKLYSYEKAIENELLTYLGINNMPVQEKKERFLTDELNMNNQLICTYADNFIDMLEFFKQEIKDAFDIDVDFVCKHHVESFVAEDHNMPQEEVIEDDESSESE